ncbi:MAG: hypothetical protein AAF960_02240 [Bacteroidota bacterium]
MRVLKWILGIILVLAIVAGVGLFIFVKVKSEPRPQGIKGPEAEALAQKVLAAIDKPAWDTTGVIQWTFPGGHDFLWDKDRNLVKVNWEDYEVLVTLDETTGRAWKGGQEVTGEAGDKLVKEAWGYFCNDSFWLNAPAKVFDKGTERSVVTMPEGNEALMVTYQSGGVTPGDSYLWILDDNGLPASYKMWVSIIPIGGMEFTWEDYTTVSTGAKIATQHNSDYLPIKITNIKATTDLAAFGLSKDPFQPIL